MKKYKNRYLRKISNAINIAYLSTAILWGYATYYFCEDWEELKQDYLYGEISQEEYLSESKKFTEKEEEVFKMLSIGFGSIFTSDVLFTIFFDEKEF